MTATKAISVLIVDDSELVRTGLKTLLDLHGEALAHRLRVVGEAATMAAAVTDRAAEFACPIGSSSQCVGNRGSGRRMSSDLIASLLLLRGVARCPGY